MKSQLTSVLSPVVVIPSIFLGGYYKQLSLSTCIAAAESNVVIKSDEKAAPGSRLLMLLHFRQQLSPLFSCRPEFEFQHITFPLY